MRRNLHLAIIREKRPAILYNFNKRKSEGRIRINKKRRSGSETGN
jgi:hypothetical protein